MVSSLALHYQWWMLALLLLAAEVIVPGFFMLWIGIAAGVMGIVVWIFPDLSLLTQGLLFSVLSFISCIVYWKLISPKMSHKTDQPHLNRRAEQFVGKRYVLETAIINGSGKARVGDSLWLVEGPDLPAGTVVQVKAVEGSTLKVKAAGE